MNIFFGNLQNMGHLKSDHIKWLISLTVIALSYTFTVTKTNNTSSNYNEINLHYYLNYEI